LSAVCYRGSPEGAFPGLAAQDVSRAPVGLAVAACIAAGRTEPGGVEEQYQVLDGATELLVAAPDDEVVGELLMLQVGLGGRGWGGGEGQAAWPSRVPAAAQSVLGGATPVAPSPCPSRRRSCCSSR